MARRTRCSDAGYVYHLLKKKKEEKRRSRVERGRGGLGNAYLLPALSLAGASRARPYSVSTSRSSNRTCGFPASGSRTRSHACAHEKGGGRPSSRISPRRRRYGSE